MNNVSLIGRLTADPELKHTQSGLANVRFSIAVDRQFAKQGEERQADFINIVAWRQTAEFICKYFGKGQRIALTGRIQTGSYTDRDGNKRYSFDVLAENVEFCEKKSEGNRTASDNVTVPSVQAVPDDIGRFVELPFFTEAKFSKFYSVAPDGALSREIQQQIKEIIASSPALDGKFKIRRDDILCLLNQNDYVPLSFSTSRLDGKLPNAFVADEVGALPINYPIEAMRSGQLMIRNKLGCIISTKYPTIDNPFEDEVRKAKQVLEGIVEDDTVFSLLYEPDKTKDWETDDSLIEQSNPLAIEIPMVMEDIKKKRSDAVMMPSKRENFLTKHLNIIYQGLGTETFIDVHDVMSCRTERIDWTDRTAYIGVDLSETTDNTAVAIAALDDDGETILADVIGFVPADSVESKSRTEKVDYRQFIEEMKCIACGGRVIDYSVVEEFVFNIEEKYGCRISCIGFDRRNAMSSAQKWDEKYPTTEIRQHSSTLHAPTKLLQERILEGKFRYEENRLLELNFQNARVNFDTNMSMYVTKKKSSGKVDMVVALINAVYLLQKYELEDADSEFAVYYFE